MIRKVHVVCKTHLDIGFTDLARNVMDHYIYSYLPAAVDLARQVNQPGNPKRFVWTVGAYLVDEALRTLDGEARQRLDEAVRNGWIAYHAMPYTVHSELCSTELFAAGLGIFQRLDERYGLHTTAAKMSDVPGHTLGIIHPLVQGGVHFLHIGINDVACHAQVPSLFRWENATGESLVVNYTRGYGGVTVLDGHDEALCVLHTNDNMGPPSPQRLEQEYRRLGEQYPGAEIVASTLDAFDRSLESMVAQLPVIRSEIGDTWIHGVGTDPEKTRCLRALSRLSAKWDRDGIWDQVGAMPDGRSGRQAFLEGLLLVCEHTWGLDTKKYLTDFTNWNRVDFDRARVLDVLRDAYGNIPGYEEAFAFGKREFLNLAPEHIHWLDRSYSLFESSHEEQRAYLNRAVEALPLTLRQEACTIMQDADSRHEFPALSFAPKPLDANHWKIGDFQVSVAPDGELEICAGELKLGFAPPVYQETGRGTFERLVTHYLEHVEENSAWAIPDNGKPGLEYSDAPEQNVHHRPVCCSAPGLAQGRLRLEWTFDEKPGITAGCPERCVLELWAVEQGQCMVSLRFLEKPANRKPEAMFYPLRIPKEALVALRKIGDWVNPADVVPKGNARVHAVQALRVEQGKSVLQITPLDTPLVTIGAPDLLDFDVQERDGIFFNLYNNLWGTNFKMWYEEDFTCRFLLNWREDAQCD